MNSTDVEDVPRYGIKRKLNHKYPERRDQNFFLTLRQLWVMLPLIFRYIIYYIKNKWQGKAIIMDYVHSQNGQQIYGVPLGGIGAGTIGRGFKGEFCRYQLIPGMYQYNTVDANQFIVTIKDGKETIFQSTLSTFKKRSLKTWKSLIDPEKCLYTGLYPRAWTEYDLAEYGVKLICRQISPVIPHNYKDSSLPCGVFVWKIENVCNEPRTVTIAFTFKNGVGNKKIDRQSVCSSKSFSYLGAEGVILHQTIKKMKCTYALAVKSEENVETSKCLHFDPNSDGGDIWSELYKVGRFGNGDTEKSDNVYGEMGVGIAAQALLPAGSAQDFEMCLVWDMPVVGFPGGRRKYSKFYTKYFGSSDATLKIVDFALNQYKKWEKDIHFYQKNVLLDKELPDWYKSAIFNESYYISDGGTLWFALDEKEAVTLPKTDPRLEFGRFAYLEGHEYRMYNTYDVHFYASYALIMNFPLLQLVLQYDFKDAIYLEIPEKETMLYDGVVVERKVKNTVPHDVGDPDDEPFLLPNSYPIHDVSEWRDLNTKFVLQVLRDYFCCKNDVDGVSYKTHLDSYLQDMYDVCKVVMDKSLKFDVDGDGLIENSGSPDQTYDTWIMTGSSAYCGGLWLAALFAMTKFADILNKAEDKEKYSALLEKGRKSYEKKLWNGKYYNFDCSTDEFESVMADQLCGHWYLSCSGYNDKVFAKEKVQSALKCVYENNVKNFCDGKMGAVNGCVRGKVDRFTIQSEEVWVGVTYALASHFLHEGMLDECWKTAGGMYTFIYDTIGMGFETPEALHMKKHYRAIGYMRPLSIWSVQLAWEQRQQKLKK